ncbi:hypothetical protein ACM43_04890 [Bradyrhizobium sp. CCBAU 45321]|nr:hypothetical protein [Bradyrhizobium sp. CCBAU 45321]
MRYAIQTLLFAFPWTLRRRFLSLLWGYKLAPDCYVGFSWIGAKRLRMENSSRIGHLTFVKGVAQLELGRSARIGNLNWITGDSVESGLLVEEHAAITHRHLIDCTALVTIGQFSTFAGWRSQLLTHSIDVSQSRQTSDPVQIGRFCFVGTGVIILKGASLPDYSVLAAGSVLIDRPTEEYTIYGGVPARPVGKLPRETMYFNRGSGFVH